MLRFLSFTKSFDYIQKEPDSEVVIGLGGFQFMPTQFGWFYKKAEF